MNLINAIACVSSDSGLGRTDGSLLFHIKNDLQRFKELTLNNHVLMGRKTFDSIVEMRGGKLLPNRHTAIITRNKDYKSKYGEHVYTDLSRIINHAKTLTDKDKTIWICGGGELYSEMLEHCSEIYLTHVNKHIEGDDIIYYPMQKQIDLGFIPVETSEDFWSDKYQCYYKFVRYEKPNKTDEGDENGKE